MFTTGLGDSRTGLLQVYRIQGIQECVYHRFIGFKNVFITGL